METGQESLGERVLYDEEFYEDGSPNWERLKQERCFNPILKESKDKVTDALAQLTGCDFIFNEHSMILQSLFTEPLFFFLWIFDRAISKDVSLPLEYAREFLKFIVCLDMSNSLPLSVILGDEQGHNQVTVASELRRIIQHYKEQLMDSSQEYLKHILRNSQRLTIRAGPLVIRAQVWPLAILSQSFQQLQEVPTGFPETNAGPSKRPEEKEYSALMAAIRILSAAGLNIQEIDDAGNEVIVLLKEVDKGEPGAKEKLYDRLNVDHPTDYIEVILDQLPNYKELFVVRRICQCRSPIHDAEVSVTLKGTRPPTVPQLALEQALREAGKKRAFCHNCRTQSSKEELARLEGSHCNETEFILLSLPVLSKEGAPITCAVGQGTPDFDIPLSFANSGWSLKAMALHESGSRRYFTCVLPSLPSHLYYFDERDSALPPQYPVAREATLWLFRSVPLDCSIISRRSVDL